MTGSTKGAADGRRPGAVIGETRRAALGIPDPERAGTLAREMARRAFVPVLAFTRDQVLDTIADPGVAVAIVDLKVAGPDHCTFPRVLGERSPVPMLLLSDSRLDTLNLADPRRQVHLHPSVEPGELATAADTLTRAFRTSEPDGALVWGPLRLEPRTRTGAFEGRPLTLTHHQFRLLTVLTRARGGVVSREEIHAHVFGTEAVDDCERITAHVRRIRMKLEADPSHPRFLLTARGEGFRLADVGAEVDLTDWDSGRDGTDRGRTGTLRVSRRPLNGRRTAHPTPVP